MSTKYPDLSLTVFPDGGIDEFLTYLDIVASDGPLIQQYMDAMNTGNTTLANQILGQIPSATQKIIRATDLNKLTQAMLAVERFFKTDIWPHIEEKQAEWLNVINQFSYKGAWSAGQSYQINNFVTYTLSGITLLYVAVAVPPVGTLPTDTRYWRLLTIQGQQGVSGKGLSYRQKWGATIQYGVNDVVTYGGAVWVALQNSQGVAPSEDPSVAQYWKLVLPLIVTTYPIQDTPPINQKVGDLWLNTSNNLTKYYYLTALDSPAKPEDILEGFQAFDAMGNLINGTRKAVNMTGIEVSAPPNETQYVLGEKFNPTGMKISAVFADGSKMQVDGWTYTPTTPLTVNDTEITISYTAFGQTWTVKQSITVTIFSSVLAENTWEKINEASTSGQASSLWKVGDTKDIVVNGETLTVVIMGFNHDDLESGGKTGITFGLKNLMENTRQMNSSNTNIGGFTGSEMYSWLQNTLLKQLPSDLQAVLKSVNKKTSAGDASSTININAMKLFLFSEIEIFGMTTYSASGEGTQYPYFATAGNRIKHLANGTGSAYWWWERSPRASNSNDFCYVNSDGNASLSSASNSGGVCFGFCV